MGRCFGLFRNVRSPHHDRHARGADSIRDAVCLCYHPGHCPDSHKSDVVFPHESRDAVFIHWLCVAINQQYFVAGRSQCLEEKHPKMWHEITRDAVIGVVKQNPHHFFSM